MVSTHQKQPQGEGSHRFEHGISREFHDVGTDAPFALLVDQPDRRLKLTQTRLERAKTANRSDTTNQKLQEDITISSFVYTLSPLCL